MATTILGDEVSVFVRSVVYQLNVECMTLLLNGQQSDFESLETFAIQDAFLPAGTVHILLRLGF